MAASGGCGFEAGAELVFGGVLVGGAFAAGGAAGAGGGSQGGSSSSGGGPSSLVAWVLIASYCSKIRYKPPGGNAGSIYTFMGFLLASRREDEDDEEDCMGLASGSGSASGARGLCLSGLKTSGSPSSSGFSPLRLTGTAGRSSISPPGGGFFR